MKLIDRETLRAKLDRGDTFKLVMTMGEWAFRTKHIPGSLNVSQPDEALKRLKQDDEIVVYCSSPSCVASQAAYRALTQQGYNNVWYYAGGLLDWEEAGYPLEGEWA